MKRHIDCLTVMLTNQCPLRCAHCGPRSGPGERGALKLELIISALDEARERLCRVVNFSGGEPFILGESLTAFVEAAAQRSMIPRVTTGAYWSNSAAAAKRRLEPLAAAGLRQLAVSCSDAHREFVPIENVIEAARAARHYGIELYLALGTSKTSKTCSRTVREAFEAAGELPPWLYESPYIPFGRASDQVPASDLILQPVERFVGACPSLTVNPTIHADGNVTGCAVVFGRECPALAYGNIHETPLGEILDLMNCDPLAAWIHKIGVVELKRFIEDNSNIKFDEHYVNICHLCGTIMNSPEALEFLEAVGLRSTEEAIAT